MQFRSLAVLSFVAAVAIPSSVSAQEAARWNFGLGPSLVQYDLVGVGNTPGVAVRAARDLSPHVVLETRGLFAWPDQTSGRSTMFIPEAQLQYRWNIARFSPFVGGGAGFARVSSPVRTDWDTTLSLAGGTGIRLTDRMGVIGELRLRGIDNFAASTAEWTVAMTWRLPTF
jgi:opacity protein-like surface antigen